MLLTPALLCLALAAGADPAPTTASGYVSRGMQRFQDNDVGGSLEDFDRAAEMSPKVVPKLWQRGISQYYLEQYTAGRAQFEEHKPANPHDVENATWHFICVARVDGVDAARKALIDIDTTRDTRIPMAEIYEFYAGNGSADAVLAAAQAAGTEQAHMYAHLYLALFYEAAGNAAKAEGHMRQSAAAKLKNSYMHNVARIHMAQRNWDR